MLQYDAAVESYTVRMDGWTASLGVFPVSIKNEAFLALIEDPKIQVPSSSPPPSSGQAAGLGRGCRRRGRRCGSR